MANDYQVLATGLLARKLRECKSHALASGVSGTTSQKQIALKLMAMINRQQPDKQMVAGQQ